MKFKLALALVVSLVVTGGGISYAASQHSEAGFAGGLVIGKTIRDENGKTVGKIENIVLDNSGCIKFALLSGGFKGAQRGKYYPVPWNMVRVNDPEHFVVTIDREVFVDAPSFAVTKNFAFTPEWDNRVIVYYRDKAGSRHEGRSDRDRMDRDRVDVKSRENRDNNRSEILGTLPGAADERHKNLDRRGKDKDKSDVSRNEKNDQSDRDRSRNRNDKSLNRSEDHRDKTDKNHRSKADDKVGADERKVDKNVAPAGEDPKKNSSNAGESLRRTDQPRNRAGGNLERSVDSVDRAGNRTSDSVKSSVGRESGSASDMGNKAPKELKNDMGSDRNKDR